MQFIFICCAQRFSFKVLYSLIFPFGSEPYRLYVRYPSDFERTSSNRLLTVATSIFHNINRVVNIAILSIAKTILSIAKVIASWMGQR